MLTGHEELAVEGVENGEASEVTVRADGKEFRARVRLDTPREREYCGTAGSSGTCCGGCLVPGSGARSAGALAAAAAAILASWYAMRSARAAECARNAHGSQLSASSSSVLFCLFLFSIVSVLQSPPYHVDVLGDVRQVPVDVEDSARDSRDVRSPNAASTTTWSPLGDASARWPTSSCPIRARASLRAGAGARTITWRVVVGRVRAT